MARTLRIRARTGWTTKPAADLPENRLTAEEVDDTFLDLWDSMPVCVRQEAGQSLPSRPNAEIVFWFSWTQPPSSSDNPYDQWFEIPEIAAPAAPAAPTSLVATSGDTEVSLAWTASATSGTNAPTGHRVYRHTSNTFASATQVGSDLGAAAASYTDTGLTNGTEYFYWVTAFNATGESGESNGDSATPAASSVDIMTDIAWTSAYLADDAGVANGAEVTSLADGVSTRDLSATNGPEYIAADTDFNNQPSLSFDGVNEKLTATGPSDISTPYQVVLVCVFGGDGDVVAAFNNTINPTGLSIFRSGTKVRAFAGTAQSSTEDASTTTAQLVRVRVAGSSLSAIDVDGTVTSSLSLGDRDIKDIFVGGNSTTGFTSCKVAFVGYKSTDLTLQEVTDIEAWANDKYGITLA